MRTKNCIISFVNDVLFSYDLHIIDVLNILKNRMKEFEFLEYVDMMTSLYNSGETLPYHELVVNNEKLEIVSISDRKPINHFTFASVIYTKGDEFISKPVYDKLVKDGYKSTIEFTPIRYKNLNSANFLEMFNNFIIVRDDYGWSELSLVSNNLNGGDLKQLIAWSKVGDWLNNHVEAKGDDSLALIMTLIGANPDIDLELMEHTKDGLSDDKKDLIYCESRICVLSKRIDLEKLKEMKINGDSYRSNLGIVRMFDTKITNKR